MGTRRALALVTLALSTLAVMATSPKKWNLEVARTAGAASIPANGRTLQQRVELRLVPPAMAGDVNVSFTLVVTAASATGGHAAHLRARAEESREWTEFHVTPNHYGVVTSTTAAPCSARGCSARFVLEWVRDEADASAAAPVEWTAQGSASGIGDDRPSALRLELVTLP